MRTTILAAALTAVLLAAIAPGASRESDPCGHEATETVHLRTGPSDTRSSRGLLRRGDDVTVLRESGDWYRVSLDERSRSGLRADTKGWAPKHHLRPRACARPNG
ncbi:SH3 domain-containing protein [Streptomyces sp. CC208A]|uniref:SH3 domain-containing protein n=1 Tax=Streptomyces sp. CC208A TaxID=3044573 RepID=UPI0024A95955|nr:SH3 domain-containing protein [Streptomyces sp. CC208A]